MIRRQLLTSAALLAAFTLLLGLVYPLVVTGLAKVTMEDQADGSLVRRNGHVVGSDLIGQSFEGPRWFHPRPGSYDPTASGASNLGPTNPELLDLLETQLAEVAEAQAADPNQIPIDAITTSASNLDPDISVIYAHLQAARVARERGLELTDVMDLIEEATIGRDLGFLGEPRVRVFRLNLALEELDGRAP